MAHRLDGSLTAQWCQQQEPGTPVNFYEASATCYQVKTTTWTRTVRHGWTGREAAPSGEGGRGGDA